MATIYDVARVAGVSITTVSHVINGTRFVRKETKNRVLEAVEELNYSPNSLARAMVRQETQTIGLIVPDNVNPFFAEMARGVENYGFEAGYSVMLCNSDLDGTKEQAYLKMLISKQVDGVIYIPTGTSPELFQLLVEHKIPRVTFDREYEGFDAILLDNLGGGYRAARHLIELGHRRIGCISGPLLQDRSQERVVGYRQALAEAGIEARADWVVSGNWDFESGWYGVRQLLEGPSPPTAIFACNDLIAIGAIASLRERGLRVPEELSIVGYDNITLSGYVTPALTTIVTPILTIGEQLCQMLLNRIDGQCSPEPQRATIAGELLVRGSTAPPPRGR